MAGHNQDFGAEGKQLFGDGQADAVGAACDEGAAAGEGLAVGHAVVLEINAVFAILNGKTPGLTEQSGRSRAARAITSLLGSFNNGATKAGLRLSA
ncbi:hypothetical protein GCM10027345_44840 [Hymenobacter daeguensis]